MSSDRSDDVLADLRRLAEVDPPAELSVRVRGLGRAELEASGSRGGRWLTLAARAWMRVGLPAALAVMVVAYLSWAVSSASALYR
jgi:hypothetical protein